MRLLALALLGGAAANTTHRQLQVPSPPQLSAHARPTLRAAGARPTMSWHFAALALALLLAVACCRERYLRVCLRLRPMPG